jgi:hypothetical protein
MIPLNTYKIHFLKNPIIPPGVVVCMAVIPTLGRLRQKDQEFNAREQNHKSKLLITKNLNLLVNISNN